MNTKQAFTYLTDHWKSYPNDLTTKYKLAKSRFLNAKPLSESKMKEVLLQFGFQIVSELNWQKPKSK